MNWRKVYGPNNVKAPAREVLWSNAVHTFGTSVFSFALTITLSVIIARTLGPAGKGSYDLAIATVGLLSTFLGFAIPTGITYVFAQSHPVSRRLIAVLVCLALVQGLVAALLLFSVVNTDLARMFLPPQWERTAVFSMALLLVVTMLTSYWRAIIVGRQKITQMNLVDLSTQFVMLVVVLWTIWLSRSRGVSLSAEVFLWISVGTAAFSAALSFRLLLPEFAPGPIVGPLRSVLHYAAPCFAANLAQFLNYRLGLFTISLLAGVAAAGLYSLAVSLAQFLWLFSNAMAVVLLPNVAATQQDSRGNAQRTAQSSRIVFWVTALGAALLGVSAQVVIPLVYGQRFQGSVGPFVLVLPGVAFFSIANVLAAYIAGIGRPRLNLLASFLGLLTIIPLNIVLIPILGVNGAALATSLSYTVSTITLIVAFVRESKLPLRSILLLSADDWRVLLALVRRVAGIGARTTSDESV